MYSSPARRATSVRPSSQSCSQAGHEVTGLARSDEAAATIEAAGAAVQRGTLDDLDILRQAAGDADGVIHLAFKHDWMASGDFQGAVDADFRAITAMGEALIGSEKPFVTTSGTLMLTFGGVSGRPGTEADVLAGGPACDAENHVVALAEQGVRSSVVRLPPTVHSYLDLHGFVPTLIGFARKTGLAGYVGDGANRWPAVHTLDAARVYRLALESGPAGRRYHAVSDEGVPFREIAEAIGRNLGVPTASIAGGRRSICSSGSSRDSSAQTIQRPASRPVRRSAGSPPTRC